jgi:hypothetical protein
VKPTRHHDLLEGAPDDPLVITGPAIVLVYGVGSCDPLVNACYPDEESRHALWRWVASDSEVQERLEAALGRPPGSIRQVVEDVLDSLADDGLIDPPPAE